MTVCCCTSSNSPKASTMMPAGSSASYSANTLVLLRSTVIAVLIFLACVYLIIEIALAGLIISLVNVLFISIAGMAWSQRHSAR